MISKVILALIVASTSSAWARSEFAFTGPEAPPAKVPPPAKTPNNPPLVNPPAKRAEPIGRSPINSPNCNKIWPTVVEVLGEQRARCYMHLFNKETTCQPGLSQAKGNAGNAHAGYGVCTIERDKAIRIQNGRGPDCMNIVTLVDQIKCCRAIMRRTPHYFGPVLAKKVPQCH